MNNVKHKISKIEAKVVFRGKFIYSSPYIKKYLFKINVSSF